MKIIHTLKGRFLFISALILGLVMFIAAGPVLTYVRAANSSRPQADFNGDGHADPVIPLSVLQLLKGGFFYILGSDACSRIPLQTLLSSGR